MSANFVQGCYFRAFSGGSFGLRQPSLPLALPTASCWPHRSPAFLVRSRGLRTAQLACLEMGRAGQGRHPEDLWAPSWPPSMMEADLIGGEQSVCGPLVWSLPVDSRTDPTTSACLIPPKPGLMLKSWSSILRSCSDLVSGDLVISGLRFKMGLPRRRETGSSQIPIKTD